jgi:CBS domain-containing protein
MKKVKDLMNRHVFFVKPHHSIYDVARVFAKSEISGAPVVDGGRVVGVLSLSDIVSFMGLKLAESEVIPHEPNSLSMLILNLIKLGKDYSEFKKELDRISKFTVKDVMSKEVVFINPDSDLFEAANIMDKYDVNRLPVIDDGKLIGVISRADLIKALID